MADVQIAIIDQQNTQIAIIDQQNTQIALAAPSETEVTVAVPGIQGPVGEGVPSGGTTNQVLFKQSGTDYDTAWSEVTSAMIGDLEITNADVAANAEIAVSKLADGAARQLLQTDAAGTGVEWTSNVDVPGTLDVTGAATLDSTLTVPLGSAASPTLRFSGDTNSGIYSPGADQVAVATNGTGRLFVDASGRVGIGGSPNRLLTVNDTSQPGIALSVTNTEKLRLQSTASLNYVDLVGQDLILRGGPAGSSERLRITSGGLVGIGTSSPQTLLELSASNSSIPSGNPPLNILRFNDTDSGTAGGQPTGRIEFYVNDAGAGGTGVGSFIEGAAGGSTGGGRIRFGTSNSGATGASTKVVIDDSGRVGIGTQSAVDLLMLEGGQLHINRGATDDNRVYFGLNSSPTVVNRRSYIGSTRSSGNGQDLVFGTNVNGADGTEKARIDSSGRLLVGTSTARSNVDAGNGLIAPQVQIEGTDAASSSLSIIRNTASANTFPRLYLAKTRSGGVGGNVAVTSDDTLGELLFNGADGTNLVEAASISAEVDGNPGPNDMPGRLVFSTTADGASSPTERMRITNDGRLYVNTDGVTPPVGQGLFIAYGTGSAISYRADSVADTVGIINRYTDDGVLISLRQANTQEGAISVSGTTVTYGGGHLARWSQLPNDEDPSAILKGTVLSNLDEMCEWGDEDNEQLNKTKVSDVEGDPNVAGVFVSTSFSDDGPLDFFVGMTGDMVIRIAQGVTVERGDLLMSAGDGTAKPQDDDIIRSKTIAKVTSTNVSCTYEDGSYCVPCVLMAC
jgi:hypothetical protein